MALRPEAPHPCLSLSGGVTRGNHGLYILLRTREMGFVSADLAECLRAFEYIMRRGRGWKKMLSSYLGERKPKLAESGTRDSVPGDICGWKRNASVQIKIKAVLLRSLSAALV